MKHTWLIQRLNAPYKTPDNSSMAEIFSFGGGFQNGGLSKEAMNLIRPIFSFDYMGSAEFEWGAVPESLSRIAKGCGSGEYGTHTLIRNKVKVYVICKERERQDVNDLLDLLRKGKVQLKEQSYFKYVIDHMAGNKEDEYVSRTKGWLELDNDFFFFVDEDMFRKVAHLFGLIEYKTAENAAEDPEGKQ